MNILKKTQNKIIVQHGFTFNIIYRIHMSKSFSGATYGSVDSCTHVVHVTCGQAPCGSPTKDPETASFRAAKIVNGDLAEGEAWPWMVSIKEVIGTS